MFCKYCGKKNDDNASFCAFCGGKIGDNDNNLAVCDSTQNVVHANNKKKISFILIGAIALIALMIIIVNVNKTSKDSPGREDKKITKEEKTIENENINEDEIVLAEIEEEEPEIVEEGPEFMGGYTSDVSTSRKDEPTSIYGYPINDVNVLTSGGKVTSIYYRFSDGTAFERVRVKMAEELGAHYDVSEYYDAALSKIELYYKGDGHRVRLAYSEDVYGKQETVIHVDVDYFSK